MDGVRTAEGGEGVTGVMIRARIWVDGEKAQEIPLNGSVVSTVDVSPLAGDRTTHHPHFPIDTINLATLGRSI